MLSMINEFLNLTTLEQGEGYPVYTGKDSALVIKVKSVVGIFVFFVMWFIIHFSGWEVFAAMVATCAALPSFKLKLAHPVENPKEKE